MNIRFIAFFMAFLVLPMTAARAAPVVVTASELSTLLTGNTIHGTWVGDEYKQYFGKDGSTIYATKTSPSSLGKWRLNHEKNLYESWWQRSDWSGYQVVRENGALFWVSKDYGLQPFEVLSGQQLVWQ